MSKEIKYKKSGDMLLGLIPENWELKRIKYISKVQGRVGFKGYSKNDIVSEGEGALTIGAKHIKKNKINIEDPEYLSWGKYYESPEIYVEKGQILVVQRGSLGKVAIVEDELGPATINPSMVILKDLLIDTKYLYYIFCSKYFLNFIDLINSSTAVPMISQEQLGNLFIPKPSLGEIEKINIFLDQKTAEIDNLISKKEKLIECLNEEKIALIHRLVTKGLNEKFNFKETQIDWIGEIPEHWDCKRIKMLSRVKRGASPRPIDNPIYFDYEGEFAWVRIADLTASERYLYDTTQRLSELGSSLSVKRYPNDFFLSIAGTVGKPIITKIKCCIHDGFVYFPDLKINPEFLYYIFSTGLPYLGLGKMGTQLNLNTDTVGDIYIPLPNENEIDEIVQQLDLQAGKIDGAIRKINTEIDLIKEYRTSLINEVVTGKITLN